MSSIQTCKGCENSTYNDNITKLRFCRYCGRCEGCQILDHQYPFYSNIAFCQCVAGNYIYCPKIPKG